MRQPLENEAAPPMRICLLSARFPPQHCGVGDYTCFLAGALARIGFDVDVLTATGERDELLYPLPPNVHVHRVINDWGTKRLPYVIRYLRKLDPQVLLIQYAPHAFDRRGITFAVNVLPALVRVSAQMRVITNFHELYIPFDQSLKRNVAALWQRAAVRILATGSHMLSVTATEWELRLKRMGVGKRIDVIPVGSNIPLAMTGEADRTRLRKQLLGDSNGFLVGGFGARHDRDIPNALHALGRLKRERSAKLAWIGGGSASEDERVRVAETMRLHGLEEDDVNWTGQLPHCDVSTLLSVCDLIMLPFVDGVSTRRTSAVTALQHGLPLLTTRGTRQEPWFVHGQNVYLVPAGDRHGLADGLMELASKPELRAALREGARTLYDARFAWHVIAEQAARLAFEEPRREVGIDRRDQRSSTSAKVRGDD